MRAAAVQLNSTADRDRNLEAADRLDARRRRRRARRSSCCPRSGRCSARPEETAAGAEPLDGPALTWARGAARELGIDLVAGSIAERVEGADARAQHVACTSAPTARSRATYRKIHMFDVEVGGTRLPRVRAPRSRATRSSSRATADGVELGLSICYDLRFPELYRELAVRGARVIAVPAAFTLATTREHWEVLLRARAIEDQAFVVAANQIGQHAPGIRSRRALDDRRPVGPRARAGARQPRRSRSPTSTSSARREIRRTLPSLANRRLGTEAHA